MENSLGWLFKPEHPHQPVATLLLVENSQAMSHIWSDLRDNHLKRLIDDLVQANPSVSITVSVLESYPSQIPGPNHSIHRQYSGFYDSLHDLSFNPDPSNKITAGRVDYCIEMLDSFKSRNQMAALHLIVVAATTPSDDDNLAFSGNNYSPWTFLAQKLVEKNIFCHIVVSPQQEMGSLTLLFEETGNIEKSLYTSNGSTQLRFRLSARPSYEPRIDARPASSLPVGRIAPLRRNSYPLDNFYGEVTHDSTSAAVPAEGDQPPSLVSQLQQVHGLTKKKVYGAKPVRQPFFKEERVQHKYRPPPTPLTVPMPPTEQIPSPTAGGRALSQSRADRLGRLSQSSPTDTHARRQPTWARRGSRLSTPEPDFPWPIAPSGHANNASPGSSSYMSSNLSSPITPATTIDDVYTSSTCLPAMPLPPVYGASPESAPQYQGGTPEGYWPPPPAPPYVDSYNPSVQTYFPPFTHTHQYRPEGVQNTDDFDMRTPEFQPGIHQPTLAAMDSHSQPAMQMLVPSETRPPLSQQYFMQSAYSSPPSMQPQQQALPSGYDLHIVQNAQQPPQTTLSSPSQISSPSDPNAVQQTLQTIAEQTAPSSDGVNAVEATKHTSAMIAAPPVSERTVVLDQTSTSSRVSKKAASQDEERFTFGKEFVAATAFLFEEEVLPAYPDFPGMSSGLCTDGIERTLPSTLSASQAGELYATRRKQNTQPSNVTTIATLQRPQAPVSTSYMAGSVPAPNGTMATAIAAPSLSYDVSYVINYDSSLTGWAGS